MLSRFYRQHPGIGLSIEEMTQDRLEADLAEDRLDLGIAFAGEHLAEIESQALFIRALSLMVGPRVSAARAPAPECRGPGPPAPGAAQRRLRHPPAHRPVLPAAGRTPPIAAEANSVSAIVEMVRRGQLATILPSSIAREQPGLRTLAFAVTTGAAQRLVLLGRKGAYRSAACLGFPAVAAGSGRGRGQPLIDHPVVGAGGLLRCSHWST